MQIQITRQQLQRMKIMVATPMYGGMCAGNYMGRMMELRSMCDKLGVHMKFDALYKESLVTRARNILADNFLRSDCNHLVFIDADIVFDPRDVLKLVALDKDIVGAPYPKKTIAWDKVVKAVELGLHEDDPNKLQDYAADFVFSPIANAEGNLCTFDVRLPMEVKETGTGFMAISRNTFDVFRKAYPEIEYRPDHARSKDFSGDRMVHAYFDTVIDPESKRYLSEDYMFCQFARRAGLEVWLCPWMATEHIGVRSYTGSIAQMARLGKDLNLTGPLNTQKTKNNVTDSN